MVTKIVMPKLGEFMEDGLVGQWLKKEGEPVKKGEIIVVVEGEKMTYELEAPASGLLRKILAPEGSSVPVFNTIAIIGEPGEEIPEIKVEVKEAEEETRKVVVLERVEEARARIRASPAVKRLAQEYGVDLTQVVGSGPEGAIIASDIEKFIEKTGTRKVERVIPLTGARKVMAKRMLYSVSTAPHCSLSLQVDASETVKLHEERGLSYTSILVKAIAEALEKHRIMNSTVEDERIKIFESINIGVAVATENGLVVPVVHDANKKSFIEIHSTVENSVKRAREDSLSRKEATGGTFTVTNLGMFGVDEFTPIINPPESAILGVGRIAEKPVVVNGDIAIKPMMQLTLSFDHRAIDGATAAKFLQTLKKIIEAPLIHDLPRA